MCCGSDRGWEWVQAIRKRLFGKELKNIIIKPTKNRSAFYYHHATAILNDVSNKIFLPPGPAPLLPLPTHPPRPHIGRHCSISDPRTGEHLEMSIFCIISAREFLFPSIRDILLLAVLSSLGFYTTTLSWFFSIASLILPLSSSKIVPPLH